MRKLIFAFCISVCQLSMAADPVANNVRVLGEGLYNGGLVTQLTGNYVFTDADGDTNVSTFQWYRSLANDGTGLTTIGGATGERYTITAGDIGYYLYFEVTPVDNNTETGTPVTSPASSIVANTSYSDHTYSSTTTVNSGGTVDYLNTTINNNKNLTVTNNTTLYIHGDLNTAKTTITVNSGSTLRISGQLIAANNLTIVNNGTLIIESGLSAGNSAAISISGNVTIGGNLTLAPGGAGSLTVESGGSLDVEGNFEVTGSDIEVNSPGTINIDGNADTGSSPINGDGDVTIGGACTGTNCGDGQITPIVLSFFRVTSEEGYNEITWSTLAEINNDYFTIYKSNDGTNYEAIAQIEGAGNHQGLLKYSYQDYDYSNQNAFYKLRQTDFDGQFEEFDAIGLNAEIKFEISVLPNPTTDWLHVYSQEPLQIVSITSLTGEVILENHNVKDTQISLSVSALKPGIYLVNVLTLKGGKSVRVLKN